MQIRIMAGEKEMYRFVERFDYSDYENPKSIVETYAIPGGRISSLTKIQKWAKSEGYTLKKVIA